MSYYIRVKFPRKFYNKKFYLNILQHQHYDNIVVWIFFSYSKNRFIPKFDYEFILPTNICSHRFLLLLIMMADVNNPIIVLVRMFAIKNPTLRFPSITKRRTRIPIILYGSIKGQRTGLNGCIIRSNRIWNTFPSMQDITRTGVNLHSFFVLSLSRRKTNDVNLG